MFQKTEKTVEKRKKLATTTSRGITQTHKEGFYSTACYCESRWWNTEYRPCWNATIQWMEWGYKYLLMVIDEFSKYGWIKPLNNRKGEIVTDAFKTLFKEGRQQKYVWIDERMWKQFTIQGDTQYLDILPRILKQYSDTKHSSITMTVVKASKRSSTWNQVNALETKMHQKQLGGQTPF